MPLWCPATYLSSLPPGRPSLPVLSGATVTVLPQPEAMVRTPDAVLRRSAAAKRMAQQSQITLNVVATGGATASCASQVSTAGSHLAHSRTRFPFAALMCARASDAEDGVLLLPGLPWVDSSSPLGCHLVSGVCRIPEHSSYCVSRREQVRQVKIEFSGSHPRHQPRVAPRVVSVLEEWHNGNLLENHQTPAPVSSLQSPVSANPCKGPRRNIQGKPAGTRVVEELDVPTWVPPAVEVLAGSCSARPARPALPGSVQP